MKKDYQSRHKITGLILVALFLSLQAMQGRPWTNEDGKTIEAEYLSHNEEEVTLKFKGKNIIYAIDKLSQKDRDWLKSQDLNQSEEKNEEQKQVADLLGFRNPVPIDYRQFEDLADYSKKKPRRAWFKAHEQGAFGSTGTTEDWLKRDASTDKCVVYCPDNYDGTEPFGILLYVSSGSDGLIDQSWLPILKKHKLIGVSAYEVGNVVRGTKKINPHPYRATLSLDAMATVEKHYQIDPERRYVSGSSGGGHMAFTIAALYPELFKGAISSAAQSYLPSHFPGFSIRDFKRGKRGKLKWVVISGDKDFNYQEILKTGKIWEDNRLDYRFLDVPGMGHSIPAAESLEQALQWIGL